jgi:hypothetical protein
MTFGEAIEAMKGGASVTRAAWTGMSLFLVTMPSSVQVSAQPYIAIATGNYNSLHITQEVPPYVESEKTVPDIVPWVASHADMLADDWQKL